MTDSTFTENLTLFDGIDVVLDDVELSSDGLTARVGPTTLVATYEREMTRLLAEAIYNAHHAGQSMVLVPSRLRDRDVEQILTASTPHATSAAEATLLRSGPPGADGVPTMLVEFRGVRIWLPDATGQASTSVGGSVIRVLLPSVRPAISPGYFLAESSLPMARGRDIVRLYLHLPNVKVATETWGIALKFLEERGIAYRAKVLTASEFYPRRDAMVVYLASSNRDIAGELGLLIAARGSLLDATSVFAERLAPGVALAAEPRDGRPAQRGLSFGQHRSTAVAVALLAATSRPETRIKEVINEFGASGIDATAPWKNTSTE